MATFQGIGRSLTLTLVLVGCNTIPEQGKAQRDRNREAPSCAIDMQQLGPMREPGRAKVRLASKDEIIEAHNAPAVCGPFYNVDAPALNITAGEGFLFETCLPEGLIQITSLARKAGRQNQDDAPDAPVTDLIFNRNQGATFAMRRSANDRIVVSDDFRKVEAEVEVRDETDTIALQGTITIDCNAK